MKWKTPTNTTFVWHLWFAWFPVRTTDGVTVWLERVQRKEHLDHGGSSFTYMVNVK